MRYLVQRPISGPIKIEISTDSQSFQTIFEKNFEGLQQGWKKFVLEPNFIKDKMVYFRITNLSSEQWSIPLYRLPKNLSNYKLALSDGVSKKDKVIPHGLLPLSMTEEPLFFQGEKTPIKSILNSLNQEIGFILLWFILIVFCYWQACRYWKTS